MGTFDIIVQQIANSLILGSFYGLVAIGYSMVYGIIKLLNFAHGDIYNRMFALADPIVPV